MRPLAVLLVAGLAFATAIPAATAQPSDRGCAEGEKSRRLGDGSFLCETILDGLGGGDGGGEGDAEAPVEEPSGVWRTWPVITTAPDGTACTAVDGAMLALDDPTPAIRTRDFWFEYDDLTDQGLEPAACPWLASSGQPPITRHVEDSVVQPSPRTNPGQGVVGKPTYLVTNGATTYPRTTFSTAIAGIPVSWEVEADGAFTVDWGDGTVTGPHDSVGGPWPDGDIHHTYTDRGTYTITVTQVWTVRYRRTSPAPQDTWSSFQMTTGPHLVPGFRVIELQPVRES